MNEEVCTFYATGTQSVFQPIYICRTCCPCSPNQQDTLRPSDDLKCICEACSQHCHGVLGHDIDYVGVGPCFCDCSKISSHDPCTNSCKLEHVSKQAAISLGISPSSFNGLNKTLAPKPMEEDEETKCGTVMADFPFHYGSFVLPVVRENIQVRSCLIHEALELVRHTINTHWLPREYLLLESKKLSQLELLALQIFQEHVTSNHLTEFLCEESGAEWWVQVKDIQKNEALDLHYDKDEELATLFSLGSFPTLSTVTYLTGDGDLPTSPTIIFAHTYDMSTEEGDIGIGDKRLDSSRCILYPQVFISHPRVGKHIVFDGRLLHGAPNDPLLKESPRCQSETKSIVSIDPLSHLRITFLVNIWLSRRPSKVSILSPLIRKSIIKSSELNEVVLRNSLSIEFVQQTIDTLSLSKESFDTSPERIILPFVSQGATWIDYNEDDTDDLVVGMFPPKAGPNDSVVIYYGDEVKPYFEYLDDSEGLLCQEIAEDVEYEEDYV